MFKYKRSKQRIFKTEISSTFFKDKERREPNYSLHIDESHTEVASAQLPSDLQVAPTAAVAVKKYFYQILIKMFFYN